MPTFRFYNRGRRKPPSKVVRPNRARDEAQAKQMAAVFASDWAGGMRRMRQNIDSDTLADAYLSGDYSGLIKEMRLGRTEKVVAEAMGQVGSTIEAGAMRGVGGIPNHQALRFDLKNPAIQAYTDGRAGALIQGVNDEFHLTLQHLVRARFAMGTSQGNLQMGMLEPAKRRGVAGFVLKNSLGLDTRSAGALANRAASGKYSQTQLDDYENELHIRRAGLIATTETAAALNEGQRAVWTEAAEQGLIDPSKARKVWIVDGNPCPKICEPMDGISVALDEDFLLPNGVRVPGPLAHPRCLCQTQLSVDGSDDVAGSNRQNYR